MRWFALPVVAESTEAFCPWQPTGWSWSASQPASEPTGQSRRVIFCDYCWEVLDD